MLTMCVCIHVSIHPFGFVVFPIELSSSWKIQKTSREFHKSCKYVYCIYTYVLNIDSNIENSNKKLINIQGTQVTGYPKPSINPK